MDPELANYAAIRRGQGIPDYVIEQELLSVGWTPGEIAPLFSKAGAFAAPAQITEQVAADNIGPPFSTQIITGLIIGVVLAAVVLVIGGFLEPFLSNQSIQGLSQEEANIIIFNVLFFTQLAISLGLTVLITKRLNLHPRFWFALDIFVISDYLAILGSKLLRNSVFSTIIFAFVAAVAAVILISYISTLRNKAITITTTLICLAGIVLIYKG